MKNGTRFSPTGSTWRQDAAEDAAADPRQAPSVEEVPVAPVVLPPSLLGAWGFAALSMALAGGAIVAGVQAVRLARFRTAARALTDVQDLLRVCQDRMTQMERDLPRL